MDSTYNSTHLIKPGLWKGTTMDISVSQEQGRVPVTVFHVHGDIAADTASQLLEEADRAVAGGTQNLVLDLTDVPYVGSYGIRAFSVILEKLHHGATDQNEEQLHKALRDGHSKSAHFKLVNPNPSVMKVMQYTGIVELLEVHRTVQAAVASF
jgi:anti-anti-sigma factor